MRQFPRIALVTGAGSGIGRAIALELAADGYHVVIACRSSSGANETMRQIQTAGGSSDFVRCDISDLGQIDALMAHIRKTCSRLDVLVNNAGISNTRTMDEIDEAEWDQMLATNLKGPFFLCRHAFHIMQAQNYGRIINLSSIAGERGARYSGIHYAASKGGLLALTKSFALRGAEYGITVNAVSPGTADTPMSRAEGIPSDGIPLGRAATPEEVAHAVCFLASDKAAYLTGITLDVNGGEYMHG
ncbi:MAG: SDR family NAD(P)-dependent oxidoreductase [Butyricicoccus sp.]